MCISGRAPNRDHRRGDEEISPGIGICGRPVVEKEGKGSLYSLITPSQSYNRAYVGRHMCPGKGGQVKEMEEKGERPEMHFLSQFPHSLPLEEENAISLFLSIFYFKKIEDKGPSRMPEFQRMKKARWPGLVSESSSQQTQPRRKKSLSNPPSKTHVRIAFSCIAEGEVPGAKSLLSSHPPLSP